MPKWLMRCRCYMSVSECHYDLEKLQETSAAQQSSFDYADSQLKGLSFGAGKRSCTYIRMVVGVEMGPL